MTNIKFPDANHKRLNILAGVWDTTITALNTDGSDGDASQATDSYRWMSNGHFLQHDVEAKMDGRDTQSMEIIAIDRKTGGYITRSYDADGSINDFKSKIEDLAYSIKGKVQRFAGAFSADGKTLRGQWDQLAKGKWSPLLKMELHKRA